VFWLAVLLLAAAADAQTAAPASHVRITMERNGCSMDVTCPVYKLTLGDDGSVLFEGKQHVSAHGVRSKKIQAQAVWELANRFVAIHYFDLPRYLGGCTDTPTVITSVTLGDRSHQVDNLECGNSHSLSELEDEIDQISNSKIWIRGRLRLWLHWPWFHSQS
jgi:Domain of unknown function (DUF6438)